MAYQRPSETVRNEIKRFCPRRFRRPFQTPWHVYLLYSALC
ncbi:hypothetical protein NEIFLAOT_00708 [Neisseria flavescens NRL30031/H210]|uniref:Uncharacterized protein n=1 Tax=Neisseria flavescens NRL30031/H210 TaxID=546264 RepID=C0ELA3_NEIFL|nr:hypothetical protein NEIFLAOT_00708 [Neisseria flavescens NRL30031/H210]